MPDKPRNLVLHIAGSIDSWRLTHPNVTVIEILQALEKIRNELTEAMLAEKHK